MRVGVLLLALLLCGCVTTYASHDRVVAHVVGAASVTVCQEVEVPAQPRPCIEVEGAPVSEQGASVIRVLGEMLWEAAKLLIPLL